MSDFSLPNPEMVLLPPLRIRTARLGAALARLFLNRTLAAESSLPPLHSTPPLPSTALRAAATSLLPSWSPRHGRWVS